MPRMNCARRWPAPSRRPSACAPKPRDPAAAARAADIEATLKRLTRLSERLMQLARAEGGRLRVDTPSDLRMIARIVAEDASRAGAAGRILLSLPDTPVVSTSIPTPSASCCRNLIENALRHGARPAGRCDASAGRHAARRQ